MNNKEQLSFKVNPIFITIILMFLSTFCYSKKRSSDKSNDKLSISSALESISAKLSDLSKNGRPVRLAVVPFYSAFHSSDSINKFGEYFAERSITSIKNSNQNIKLFERKRLDAITKEYALNLSGLINQNDAIKIGELVPIDYLLTGTYSKLESYIEINGRILDVVTGEIVQTFIHKLNLTNELASLFPVKKHLIVTPINKAEPKDIKPACYHDFLKLKNLMKTEGNKEIRIKKMSEIALTIPFNLECGEYHQSFIDYLRRNKSYPIDYVNYIHDEVAKFKGNPNSGSLMYTILMYFKSDSIITDKEWQLGVSLLKKSEDITHSRFTQNLFVYPKKSNITIQKKRIDQLMNLIKNGEISTGQPQSIDKGFLNLFNALTIKNGLSKLQMHLFNNYLKFLNDEKYGRDLYIKVSKIFEKENNKGNKQILIRWMGILSIHVEKNTNNGYKLLNILENLTEKADSSSQDSIVLSLFIRTMKPSMEILFPLISKGNSHKKCVELCLKNNIIIKNYTPSLEELKKMLASESYHEKRDAAFFINAYGANAKPIEKDVARLLRRSEKLSFSGATNLQWDLLKILESTQPTDPEIINTVFNLFSSKRHQVPNTAMEVMASFGDRSFPILTSDFDSAEPYIQIRVIKTLSKMNNNKDKVITFIKGVYKKSKNSTVKDTSEEALIRLGAI